MRAPSTTTPDVVVLDVVEVEEKPKVIMNPKKDLWLSTVDGYVLLIHAVLPCGIQRWQACSGRSKIPDRIHNFYNLSQQNEAS